MRWGLLALLVACYAPTIRPGSPCETDSDCAGDLRCVDKVCGDGGDPVDAPEQTGEFHKLCELDKLTVIENGVALDDAVAAALAEALVMGCQTSPTVRTVSQDDPGILDLSGRPLLPADDLGIIGGGDGPNRAIEYLLRADTPIRWAGSSTITVHERSTNRLIVEGPVSSTIDYALVMVIREPISGARILSAQGFGTEGTLISGLWFATEIAPTIFASTDTWAVVRWADTDADPGPTDGDSIVLVDSGY